jgi:Family of unknown function (DUF5681)
MVDDRKTETTERKQHRFPPGVSGNPAGRPPGARNKATVLAEKLMSDDAEAVTRAVIEAAKGGDMVAARIVLDRIVPSRRGRPVLLELGAATETSRDVSAILLALVTTMAAGEITPEEAATAASVIESKRRAIETVEIEERLKRLEKERAGGQI